MENIAIATPVRNLFVRKNPKWPPLAVGGRCVHVAVAGAGVANGLAGFCAATPVA